MVAILIDVAIVVVGLVILLYWIVGIRIIRPDRVGLVEKKWSSKGSLDKAILALNGEAGYQPDVLRGGVHFRSRLQYKIHKAPLVTIPQGQIGYVFSRDGEPLRPQQTLGRMVPGNSFEDVRYFLTNGGQRGPQRQILREGTYAFNLINFVILTESRIYYMRIEESDRQVIDGMSAALLELDAFKPVIVGTESSVTEQIIKTAAHVAKQALGDGGGATMPDPITAEESGDVVAIVTVHDGPGLPQGEIIAPLVGTDPDDPDTYHNNFQDPERFLAAGGMRGKQYQVLTDGTYFVNRLFATVEFIPKTEIEIGWTGVVVSYFGEKGEDESGDDFRHGELVDIGKRGVWKDPLMPGKYAFNTYAGRVEKVPVTNFVLKWMHSEAGSHGFDSNLSEIELITKDAFEPTLPLSVVIQIPYREAPLVIQRFGNIRRLVEQTLDPMVASYFKNVGQKMTLIELIQRRAEIQEESTAQMREKFSRYNLRLEEVLIGTPRAMQGDDKIDQILSQLRDRQIADEQVITYERQQYAADKERELNQSKATAAQQTHLTESAIQISIQENVGRADAVKAVQEAQKITTLAGADARRIQVTAEAQGAAEARIGIGKAIAVNEQVKAYGGPGFQVAQDVMARIADAIEKSGVPLVPSTVISLGDGGDGARSDAFSGLLGLLMTLTSAEKLGISVSAAAGESDAHSALVESIKEQLLAESPASVTEPGAPAGRAADGDRGAAGPPDAQGIQASAAAVDQVAAAAAEAAQVAAAEAAQAASGAARAVAAAAEAVADTTTASSVERPAAGVAGASAAPRGSAPRPKAGGGEASAARTQPTRRRTKAEEAAKRIVDAVSHAAETAQDVLDDTGKKS
ncbi:MAG TPA: SPFH domain-containing protein [Thermoleophilia bacterium]|nr:SPFH domain-containing protein [Thermoleophilia bacterium]